MEEITRADNIIGDNIKRRREELRLTQEQLAKMTGLSCNSIINYEKGRRKPTIENIYKLCEALRITVYLLTGKPNPSGQTIDVPGMRRDSRYASPRSANQRLANQEEGFMPPSNIFLQIDDIAMVPVIDGVIRVAAGNGNAYPQVEWNVTGHMPIPKTDLIAYSWQGAKFNIITVEGDSMEPYINDGNKLLFAEGIEVGPGEVAVVSYNDTLMVKGVLQNKDGTVTLISFNKNFKDRIIDPAQHDFYVLGKALMVISSKRIPSTL